MKASGISIFLLIIISYVNLFAATIFAQEIITTNSEPRWNSFKISGYRENIVVLSKTCDLKWRDSQGRDQIRQALVAVSQKNGVVWVGLPGSQLFEMDGAIIGMVPLHDTLIARVSTNRLSSWSGTDSLEILARNIESHVNKLDGKVVTPSGANDKHVKLRDIFGLKALMNLQSAAPPESPQLLGVSLKEGMIILRMKSSVGKTLTLTLDRQLNPEKGNVDEITVFERGKIVPPTLQEELNSTK